MKKYLFLLIFLSSQAHAENIEQVLNRVFDSDTNSLKTSVVSGSMAKRTSAPEAIGATDATDFDANIYAFRGEYERSLGATEIVAGLVGAVDQTGSTTGTGGHGIGVLGWANDTVNGKHTLYAVEGKVTGRGTAANMQYVGALGQPIYIGSASSRNASSYLVGFLADPRNYSNEAQSVSVDAGGINVGFLANQITGGSSALNFSFLGNNVLQNNDDINMKKSSATGYIRSYETAGTKNIYLSHDGTNGAVGVSAGSLILGTDASSYVIASGSLGIIPLSSNSMDLGIDLFEFKNINIAGTISSDRTTTIGWVVKSQANTACTTTCTSAAVFGWDAGATTIVDATDATADKCVCAGPS